MSVRSDHRLEEKPCRKDSQKQDERISERKGANQQSQMDLQELCKLVVRWP